MNKKHEKITIYIQPFIALLFNIICCGSIFIFYHWITYHNNIIGSLEIETERLLSESKYITNEIDKKNEELPEVEKNIENIKNELNKPNIGKTPEVAIEEKYKMSLGVIDSAGKKRSELQVLNDTDEIIARYEFPVLVNPDFYQSNYFQGQDNKDFLVGILGVSLFEGCNESNDDISEKVFLDCQKAMSDEFINTINYGGIWSYDFINKKFNHILSNKGFNDISYRYIQDFQSLINGKYVYRLMTKKNNGYDYTETYLFNIQSGKSQKVDF